MNLLCFIIGHSWTYSTIRTTPPDEYVQCQVIATLKECKCCKKQIITYDDEEYND